jgi:hypothetical protein
LPSPPSLSLSYSFAAFAASSLHRRKSQCCVVPLARGVVDAIAEGVGIPCSRFSDLSWTSLSSAAAFGDTWIQVWTARCRCNNSSKFPRPLATTWLPMGLQQMGLISSFLVQEVLQQQQQQQQQEEALYPMASPKSTPRSPCPGRFARMIQQLH